MFFCAIAIEVCWECDLAVEKPDLDSEVRAQMSPREWGRTLKKTGAGHMSLQVPRKPNNAHAAHVG